MTITYVKNNNGYFICPECGIEKKNQSTMHYHIKKHELNKETATISYHNCPECDKKFLQKQTLDMHIKSRHPELLSDNSYEMQFQCPFEGCDFISNTKGNCKIHYLRKHFKSEIDKITERISSSEINCKKCNKKYSSSCAFYYHIAECLDAFDENNA
jgi:hypothetical protein